MDLNIDEICEKLQENLKKLNDLVKGNSERDLMSKIMSDFDITYNYIKELNKYCAEFVPEYATTASYDFANWIEINDFPDNLLSRCKVPNKTFVEWFIEWCNVIKTYKDFKLLIAEVNELGFKLTLPSKEEFEEYLRLKKD